MESAIGSSIPMSPRRWAPTVVALALVVVTVSLGNWQMRRAGEKRILQAQRDAAERDVPVALAAGEPDVDALAGRRVRVQGRFVPEFDVYVDNRTHRGVAGFHVLTPLRISGSDRHLLVLRGWIASDPRARARLPAVPTPDEPVMVEGIALRETPRTLELGSSPPPGPQDRMWQNVDLAGFARWSGLTMQLPIVRESQQALTAAGPWDDGLVRDWPLPGLDVDRHLGYAFQWYALAALAGALWLRFVVFGSRRAAGVE